ncbi:meprin A subunit beta-like [Pseudorasbora parva]|uniref:meprin A subunit beta-like n=1 Tax=Pseudorasbora parva TaxID=51549 RepID=UPI00351EE220
MNYRGVILRAFEQFRLKSCIDFKPRAAEEFYISVESREGCWSYNGRASPGGQTLSIGNGCGIKGIVEHEFLHALGFLHEQSRYDRDDYVTINFQNIKKGNEGYIRNRDPAVPRLSLPPPRAALAAWVKAAAVAKWEGRVPQEGGLGGEQTKAPGPAEERAQQLAAGAGSQPERAWVKAAAVAKREGLVPQEGGLSGEQTEAPGPAAERAQHLAAGAGCYESNLNKYSENLTTTQGNPYDYYSVMHYDKNAFSNGHGSTIITKRPEFQDVIGQRLDISEYDAIKLNKLYKCNSSISFLDHCSFDDESLCEMSFCSAADYGWQRVKSVRGVNVTDHTYLSKEQNGTSFFMHFSTEGRNEGDTARMESKTMTPKRDCKVQCLQFYYYHSGNESDQLNIWIQEYQSDTDTRGTLRPMDQITELPGYYWKLHHVSLNANKTFKVVFEGRKGAGNSSGGFSVDDINISETECPHTWQIRNFSTEESSTYYSPLYYSSDGYRFQAGLVVYQNYLYMHVRLVSGEYDDQLQWPCPWRQITFQMLDQNPHIQKRMSLEQSITTDPASVSSSGIYYWDNPRKNGTQVTIGNETVYVDIFSVYTYAIMKDNLTIREFIKGGDIIFLFSMQDISGLLQKDSLPCPKVTVKNFNITPDASAQKGPCAIREAPMDVVAVWSLFQKILKCYPHEQLLVLRTANVMVMPRQESRNGWWS